MDVVTALNAHVKTALADTFGMVMANMIILQASQKAGVPTIGLDLAGFQRLIETISADDRVVQMLGQAGALSKKEMWRTLVDSP